MSNSVDADEPSHLLCCLKKPIIIACGSKRVKTMNRLKLHAEVAIIEKFCIKSLQIFLCLKMLDRVAVFCDI